MASNLVSVLRDIGPCLSGTLAKHLQDRLGISSEAARQQVARRREPVRALKLTFPNRAKFLYLPEQWQSTQFWQALSTAVEASGGAYARVIWALSARGGIVPSNQLAAAAALAAVDGQLGASQVKAGLVEAGLLAEVELAGVGQVIGFARAVENEQVVAQLVSRLLAEDILLNAAMEWARRLNFGSWNRFKLRGESPAPKISRFEWDLSAPSFVSPLATLEPGSRTLKNGFLAMDVALVRLDERAVKPMVYKLETMRSMPRLGRCMQFVVADDYAPEALDALRKNGIVPATAENLFGKDVAEALRGLIETLTVAAKAVVDPAKFEAIFSVLKKLPGADGTLRGALFEFVCAEIARRVFRATNVVMNRKLRRGGQDIAEVDVRAEVGRNLLFIEAKGLLPGNVLDDEEVEKWLNTRVPEVYKASVGNPEFAGMSFHFELWITGELSPAAQQMIAKRQAEVRPAKYILGVRFGPELAKLTKGAGDASTLNVLEKHFLHHPLALALKEPSAPPPPTVAPAAYAPGQLVSSSSTPALDAVALPAPALIETPVD